MREQPVSTMTYLWTYLALMVLLGLTILGAQVDLGGWNYLIALGIATLKASLVLLFFMHLFYETALVRMVAGAALFWLAIAATLTFCDYLTRGGL